jgi:hypothetical protein
MSESYDTSFDYERTEAYPWQRKFWEWFDIEMAAGRIPDTRGQMILAGDIQCTPAPFPLAAAKAARQVPEIWNMLIYEVQRSKVDPEFAARFEGDELGHLRALGTVQTYVKWYRMKHQQGEWYYSGSANNAVYDLLWHWARDLIDEKNDAEAIRHLITRIDVCGDGEV